MEELFLGDIKHSLYGSGALVQASLRWIQSLCRVLLETQGRGCPPYVRARKNPSCMWVVL